MKPVRCKNCGELIEPNEDLENMGFRWHLDGWANEIGCPSCKIRTYQNIWAVSETDPSKITGGHFLIVRTHIKEGRRKHEK